MRKLPRGLILVAIFQFIPIIIMPLNVLKSLNAVAWGAILVLFGVLGVFLILRRGASRTASIFVQGFNIIVRLLVIVGNVMRPPEEGGFNAELAVTFAISMALSALILLYIDQPDIQLQMQS